MNFIIRWIVTAIAVGVAVWIVPGITTVGPNGTIAIAIGALVLSLVNVSIKPIAQMLSLPITVLTLGIFFLVVNALLVYIGVADYAYQRFFNDLVSGEYVREVVEYHLVNGYHGNAAVLGQARKHD